MDIRNWSLDQIMQLPDSVFGNRFLVSVQSHIGAAGTVWDISEIPFPERFVIWELHVSVSRVGVENVWCRIAFGDQLPTTTAQMDGLEPVFNGLGMQGAGPRQIFVTSLTPIILTRLKIPKQATGRRLVSEFGGTGPGAGYCTVSMVVSSIPREIPDCLISV